MDIKIGKKGEICLKIVNKDYKDLKKLKPYGFEAKLDQVLLLDKTIYVGIDKEDMENISVAIANGIKEFQKTNFKSLVIKSKYTKEVVTSAIISSYKFTKYKKDDKKQIIYIDTNNKDDFKEAKIIADSVNKARDFVNTSPDDFYPKVMAEVAKKIAKDNNLDIKILDEKELKKEKMNALLAVARASRHEPRVIHLSYKPKKAKKKIVLVGKGLTYDSGGLSLKPSDFMVSMKSDKSGAIATLGIIEAISKLKLDVEVHAILGAVENMIGGDSYKPDDVLIAKNKVSIEVKNTDAEGRLVLADCLCYAQEKIKDFDLIMDFATLTGACVVGVGEYTSGVMGNNDMLKYSFVNSANKAGEYATSLPFNRYLRKSLKSDIADISNISNTRYGGALTAGLFLDKFIEDKNKDKWLHIDIAGPAFSKSAWGIFNVSGATGAGIRMGIEFIRDFIDSNHFNK